jgi:hypothetical protein
MYICATAYQSADERLREHVKSRQAHSISSNFQKDNKGNAIVELQNSNCIDAWFGDYNESFGLFI